MSEVAWKHAPRPERELRLASMGTPRAGPMPCGVWDVIVADPPWRSDFGRTDSRSADRHYHTLDAHDIAALEIPAARDALLFLWCPASMLPTGLFVMARWGFRFRTSAVWCKPVMGVGQWFRAQHEVILLGRCGRFPAPAKGTQPRSVFHERRRGHSEKPEALQDAIERTYPGRRYLELFARRERVGWTCWGDQVQLLLPHNAEDVSEASGV